MVSYQQRIEYGGLTFEVATRPMFDAGDSFTIEATLRFGEQLVAARRAQAAPPEERIRVHHLVAHHHRWLVMDLASGSFDEEIAATPGTGEFKAVGAKADERVFVEDAHQSVDAVMRGLLAGESPLDSGPVREQIALSGSLEVLGPADLVQYFGGAGRAGTLKLDADKRRGFVELRGGHVVGASTPTIPRLGVLLVDIGSGTTEYSLFADGEVQHSGVLPVAAGHFTNDLAMVLRTPFAEAERLKVKEGCCLAHMVSDDEGISVPTVAGGSTRVVPRRELCDILQPRAEELFTLLQEDLARHGFEEAPRGGLVLTGGGAKMDGLLEMAEQIFNCSVRYGLPRGLGGLERLPLGLDGRFAIVLIQRQREALIGGGVVDAGNGAKLLDRLPIEEGCLLGGVVPSPRRVGAKGEEL